MVINDCLPSGRNIRSPYVINVSTTIVSRAAISFFVTEAHGMAFVLLEVPYICMFRYTKMLRW
jgi:hypothetical protein